MGLTIDTAVVAHVATRVEQVRTHERSCVFIGPCATMSRHDVVFGGDPVGLGIDDGAVHVPEDGAGKSTVVHAGSTIGVSRYSRRHMRRISLRAAALLVTVIPLIASCGDDDVVEVRRSVPTVLASIPHDTTAFTQGLEMSGDMLIEGTGRYGLSDRRLVRASDGAIMARLMIPTSQFGEGLTVAGDRGFHLTWREGIVHVFDPVSLGQIGMFTYAGEGWGICWDGTHLIMSNGTSRLVRRDPNDFSVVSEFEVLLDGRPVSLLNELECTPERIWANVWQTSTIMGIDPSSGRVRDVIDASSLVPQALSSDAVLNGIARDPRDGTFWITGKLWPTLYKVRLD